LNTEPLLQTNPDYSRDKHIRDSRFQDLGTRDSRFKEEVRKENNKRRCNRKSCADNSRYTSETALRGANSSSISSSASFISPCFLLLKGLVHPKMKILSVFTLPHVVPTL